MTIIRLFLSALLAVSLTSMAHAFTKEDIETEKLKLSKLDKEAFEYAMADILYKWSEDTYDNLTNARNRIARARMLVVAIDNFKERNGLKELWGPVEAVWLVSLYSGGSNFTKGWEYSHDEALALYRSGVLGSEYPPLSFRGEFTQAMKALWMDLNARSDLDGLIGEEEPHKFIKLAFGVYDDPTLCEPGEAVIWSCREDKKDRLISVCASPDPKADVKWMQYRIGKPGKLELSYPETKTDPREHFKYLPNRFSETLTFTNGAFKYFLESDNFTDETSLSVTRDNKSIYETSCVATHPFLGVTGKFMDGDLEPTRLHVLTKPFDDAKPTACKAGKKPLLSCVDEKTDDIMSICTTDIDGKTHLDFSSKRSGGISTYPGDGPHAFDSSRVEIFMGGGGPVINIKNGNEDYNLSMDSATGAGNLTYSRGGFPRHSQDCTVSHFDEGAFKSLLPKD